MEQTHQRLRQPDFAGRRAASAPAFLFTLVLLLTFAGLLAGIVGVTTVAKHVGQAPLSDPFTAYAAYFPGQPANSVTLAADGFRCELNTTPAPADLAEGCVLAGQTGAVSAIYVFIWDGTIARLDFTLHQGALSIGDLALLLGKPEIGKSGRWISLNWRERHISGASWVAYGDFSYFQSVLQLSFES